MPKPPSLLLTLALCACSSSVLWPGGVAGGTWGGDNAALIGDDTSAHVHIGCTFGTAHQPIVPGTDGKFDVTGEYNISVGPIMVGSNHPAHFTGTVAGRIMALTVTLTDTAKSLGPVELVFDQQPNMGPCPICANPTERERRMSMGRRRVIH